MIATLTSKGQVTFPKAIRERLRLEAGDKVEFTFDNKGNLIVIPVTASVKRLKGILPKPDRPITLEEMDEAIAEGAMR